MSKAVLSLGLSGLPLCVHASLRSFGWVEGGADAVLDGLLAEGCTVMVPSFSLAFSIAPPAHLRPPQNGCNYEAICQEGNPTWRYYTPDATEIDDFLGAVPAAIIARPGHVRGDHPLNSCAAVGPHADGLLAAQSALDVYAPLEALAKAGGAVILMGVGLDSLTLLHLAERQAGRTLFRRWAMGADGEPTMVEVGGCSRGFPRVEPMLAPTRRERFVGRSRWQVFSASSALEAATEAIRNNPNVTRCEDPECGRCRDAVLGGPRLTDPWESE